MKIGKFCIGLFCCLMFFATPVVAKVRIMSFQYNRPDFIRLQHESFSKFLTDDYELIVFNDAPSETLAIAIENECSKFGIQCVRYQQEWHYTDPLNDVLWAMGLQKDGWRGHTIEIMSQRPSVRHNHVIQFALDHYGYHHDDVVAIMDGDMFAIRKFSIKEMINEYDVIGTQVNCSTPYLWVTFIAFIPNQLPNLQDFKLHHGIINGRIFEGAAHTYSYFERNPSVRVKMFPYLAVNSLSEKSEEVCRDFKLTDEEIYFIKNKFVIPCMQYHMDQNLLHYRGGSDPDEKRYQTKKSILDDYLDIVFQRSE